MTWEITTVVRNGASVKVYRPIIGRVPSPSEYEAIKSRRRLHPAEHLRFGDQLPEGKVFLRVHPSAINAEQLGLPEAISRVKAANKEYWNSNIGAMRQKQKEYFAKHKEHLTQKMREWQTANAEHLARYKRDYNERTREIRASQYERKREYHIARAKVWRTGKQNIQAAYSARHRSSKRTSDLGLSKCKGWRLMFQLYFHEAARITKETGIHHSVDHLYPIKPRRGEPSGLHVPWNLRIAPTEQNLEKHNRPPTPNEIHQASVTWSEIRIFFQHKHPKWKHITQHA